MAEGTPAILIFAQKSLFRPQPELLRKVIQIRHLFLGEIGEIRKQVDLPTGGRA